MMPPFDITLLQILLTFVISLTGEVLGIYGGGSFFIQPALLAIGVPSQLVVAHEASAALGATTGSMYVFHKKGHIDYRFILWWLPGLVIGPVLGALALSVTSPKIIEWFITLVAIPGAAMTMFYKRAIHSTEQSRQTCLLSLFSGLALGFWTGFSGLGTGVISLLMLTLIFGQTIKQGSANKLPLHLVAEIVTLGSFLLKGWLTWKLFVPLLVGQLVAGYIKAHMILKMPEKLLKFIFLGSVIVIAVINMLRH